jgi:hypothetical protein
MFMKKKVIKNFQINESLKRIHSYSGSGSGGSSLCDFSSTPKIVICPAPATPGIPGPLCSNGSTTNVCSSNHTTNNWISGSGSGS